MYKSGKAIIKIVLFSALAVVLLLQCSDPSVEENYISVKVDHVPASFPVNFALYTEGSVQYVAYYDTTHQMVLARRDIGSDDWDYQVLDSRVGWDSHNYISMAVDRQGLIHLAGNMHSSPLIYFRSEKPYDIHSMKPVHRMTGTEEDIATYPEFKPGPDNELIFHYRYGISGSGYEVFNQWDETTGEWIRLIDRPLVDGRGEMNAYMQGPVSGPDGFYHIIWVWRDTPDCSTNHTLSHARSRDLLNWESIDGVPVDLPLTIDYPVLYVDTTPVKGGLLNIGIEIGFDSSGDPVIGYHKYDEEGNTQLYMTRFEDGGWNSRKVTEWDYRWDFSGYGTIVNELLLESPVPVPQTGEMAFGYDHIKYGVGQVVVDEETFEPKRTEPLTVEYPPILDSLRSEWPGMLVHKVFDNGNPDGDKRYMLRWEAMPPNRDRRPPEPFPPASLLEVIEY